MTHYPRVFVTGLGGVCASGLSPDSIFESILGGTVSINPIDSWDTEGWPYRLAGQVATDPKALIKDRKLLKLIKKTDVLGIYAGEQALKNASLHNFEDSFPEAVAQRISDRFAVYVGTCGPSYNSQYDFIPLIAASRGDLQVVGQQLAESVSPMWLLRNLPNNVLCHIGIRNQLKGANGCITDHGTSGSVALVEGFESLRMGDADRVLAIGHESPVDPQAMLFYQSLGLLDGAELKPFDAKRNGTILGEGAAALVLETESAVAERGGSIQGEILGKGCTTEASGLLPVRPDGDGIARAIRLALQQSNLQPDQIGMVVCHGNGTQNSDRSEAAALRGVFGVRIPPITSFKWAFGHLLAAAGSLDLVLAIKALQQAVVPPIAALQTLDPSFTDLPIAIKAMKPLSDIGLVLSRGFGGRNVAVIVRTASQA